MTVDSREGTFDRLGLEEIVAHALDMLGRRLSFHLLNHVGQILQDQSAVNVWVCFVEGRELMTPASINVQQQYRVLFPLCQWAEHFGHWEGFVPGSESDTSYSHVVVEVSSLVRRLVEVVEEVHTVVGIAKRAKLGIVFGELVDASLVHVFHQTGGDGKEEVEAGS